MAVIELVEELSEAAKVVREAERSRGTKVAPKKAPTGRTAEIAEDAAAESATAAKVAAEASAEASSDEAPYGEGSHAPAEDGSQPEGFPIKGNASSMLYHLPDSPFYERTIPEVWFATAEAAEAAGFELPPSQRDDEDTAAADEAEDR